MIADFDPARDYPRNIEQIDGLRRDLSDGSGHDQRFLSTQLPASIDAMTVAELRAAMARASALFYGAATTKATP